MSQRFYSDEEAEAILKLASRRDGDGSMSRETLMATATELGISPEAVEEAEKTYRLEKQESDDRVAFTKHKRSEFMNALIGLISTSAVLGAVNYFTEGRFTWVFWVFLGCGFGVFGTFREAFLLSGDEQEKAFRRWQRRRSRRAKIAQGLALSAEEREEEEDGDPSFSRGGVRVDYGRHRHELRSRR